MKNSIKARGSFRDPCGFLFYHEGLLYRRINFKYKENYDFLIDSGLYDALVNTELIVPHKEIDLTSSYSEKAYKTIQPEEVPFISYPYEWCLAS